MTGHFTRTLGPLCTGGATTERHTRAATQGGGTDSVTQSARERARKRHTQKQRQREEGRERGGCVIQVNLTSWLCPPHSRSFRCRGSVPPRVLFVRCVASGSSGDVCGRAREKRDRQAGARVCVTKRQRQRQGGMQRAAMLVTMLLVLCLQVFGGYAEEQAVRPSLPPPWLTASLEEHLGENLRSLVLNTAVESETECLPRPISPCARPLIAAVISYRDFLVGAQAYMTCCVSLPIPCCPRLPGPTPPPS